MSAPVASVEPKKARPAPRHTPAPAPAKTAPKHTDSNHALPGFARSAGQAIDAPLRQRMESRFLNDFSGVRIHPDAGQKVGSLAGNVRAVTLGNDIYFRSGAYAPATDEGQALLAHELAHVVQQSGNTGSSSGPVQSRDGHPLESEAQTAAASFRQGRPVTVSTRGVAQGPQAEEQQDHGWFLNQVLKVVPQLRPVLDRGLFNWVGDRIGEIAGNIVAEIRRPIDAISGVASSVSTHFTKLVEWISKAATSVAKGDCSVLHEAVDYIEKAIDGLTAPALDALKSGFEKVKNFFDALWQRFGAPLWEKIKEYAGAAWDKIEQFLGWIREKIQPVIDQVIVGWNQVKSWLGIGDDPDSQNGLYPWARRKIEALWDRLAAKLEPVKKPLLVVAGILLLLSPAGPIIAIGAAIGGVIEGIRWIKRHFSTPAGVVGARQVLQQIVLPAMIAAITNFAAMLAEKAGFVIGKLQAVQLNLDAAANSLQDGALGFLATPVRWIGEQFKGFLDWANTKLGSFVTWVHSTAVGFAAFLMTVVDALGEIAHAIRDLMRIPFLLAGRLWNRIPACIRDPFIDFLGLQILGRIPVFQAIAGSPEAWARTKEDVRGIIHAVFVNFDLIGAMKKTFRLMLRVLDVPVELLTAVLAKMELAWDTIKDKPVPFLKNLLKTVVLALKGFFKNILRHLANGVVGWITGQLKGTNIRLPSSWTDIGEVFGFVASILGLSLNHVFELMEQRMPKAVVDRMRQAANFLSGAWEWISLIIRGDFKTFWQRIQQKITDLKNMVIDGVITWIMENVVGAIMAQLITTADPTGVSEAIMLLVDIYRTIKTVVQYMQQILQMVERMLDAILNIAAGVLQPAANLIEEAMDRGMPVVIGFIANLAGFGNVGEEIQGVVKKIRDKVDAAILWLIDKAKAVVDAVVDAVGGAVQSVVNWWRERRRTKVGNEDHTLTFHGEGPNAQVFIESAPTRLYVFLNDLQSNPKADKPKVAQISTKLARIDELKAGTFGVGAGQEIGTLMGEIAELLKTVLPDETVIPETVIKGDATTTVARSTVGAGVIAEPLTYRPPSRSEWRGSEPQYTGPFWDQVNKHPNSYVQGHLLNHHVYGPGRDFNLVPIARTMNTRMSARCEEQVKERVLDHTKVVSYSIHVNFGTWPTQYTNIPEENLLPTSFTLTASEMKKVTPEAKGDQAADWIVDTGKPIFSGTIDNERAPDIPPTGNTPRLKRVNLNSQLPDDKRAFAMVYGIGPGKAEQLLRNNAVNPNKTIDEVTSLLSLPSGTTAEWANRRPPEVAVTGATEWE